MSSSNENNEYKTSDADTETNNDVCNYNYNDNVNDNEMTDIDSYKLDISDKIILLNDSSEKLEDMTDKDFKVETNILISNEIDDTQETQAFTQHQDQDQDQYDEEQYNDYSKEDYDLNLKLIEEKRVKYQNKLRRMKEHAEKKRLRELEKNKNIVKV